MFANTRVLIFSNRINGNQNALFRNSEKHFHIYQDFLFGDGGNFARIFAIIFFLKIVNLHLDGYFVSVLFTDTKI